MVICPNCNKDPLYLVIKQEIVFTIKHIGFNDVIPDERAGEDGIKTLHCLNCGWRGWTEDYHEAKNGIIKLSCRLAEGEKL